MEDIGLNCPLCCSNTFSSKESLVEHLSNIVANINCPICNSKLPSLTQLIEHLNLNDCQLEHTNQTIIFDVRTHLQNNESSEEQTLNKTGETIIENENQNVESHEFSSDDKSENNEGSQESGVVNKMYVDLLSKQLLKSCLENQELQLLKEHGESRYVIVANESDLNSENTIVTKQNSDGTISLTTVKEMKIESDPLILQPENEQVESHEEIYSCNTCGVSFSSVIEHIQNYHNDQDVVVEEPLEENSSDTISIEYDSIETNESVSSDKQAPRRVITDTGDIVEAPLIGQTNTEVEQGTLVSISPTNKLVLPSNGEVVDKRGRSYTRRYVQIDCDSVIKDIKKDEENKGPYHKVVVKEMRTLENGNKVRVYHCMSCNIYVSTLDEFKMHPCKTLKYTCSHCSVAYDNSKSLCAHMKVHKLNSETFSEALGPFKCEICSTIFPTNKSLKLHKRMHDPRKARPIEPPVSISEGTEGADGDCFLCPECDKVFPVGYRAVHQNSHTNVDKFNCEICNKKFHSNEYLEMHMNVHNLEKAPVNKSDKSLPYTCLYCSRQFARPHEKVKHERIHTGEKPHSCEICGKSFRVSYCLTLHMRTHTGARPYACPHCGKRFKAHSVYNHHLLTHSEVRAYKCPYCPKAFKTSVQLAGHKNSHTKPFSCQHCNRPFASLYAVRVHTETHARQNNLKFSCSLCGASYARTFALKDHIKQVHKRDVDAADNLVGLKEDGWVL